MLEDNEMESMTEESNEDVEDEDISDISNSHALDTSPTPWFFNMAYRRYWDHYRQVQTWIQGHKQAYIESQNVAVKSLHLMQGQAGIRTMLMPVTEWVPINSFGPFQSAAAETATSRERRHLMRKERKKRQKNKKKQKGRRRTQSESRSEKQNEIELEAVNQDSEAEGEFLKFLAANQQFKKERDADKNEEVEVKKKLNLTLSQRPKEQAGFKRTQEMQKLYGEEAAFIQALETSLQMKYDEFVDKHQPRLWPTIPLNLNP